MNFINKLTDNTGKIFLIIDKFSAFKAFGLLRVTTPLVPIFWKITSSDAAVHIPAVTFCKT
jgi:hypothetical protein